MPTVLITGASSGIGRALAHLYAEPGTRLVLVGRDPGRLAAVVQACESRGAVATAACLDLVRTDIPAWVRAVDTVSPVDLLIACAGISSGLGPGRPFEPLDAMRAVLATNLDASLALAHSLALRMAERGHGQVALVGSLAALRGLPSSPAYSAAKAALQAYGEAVRPALRRRGVALSVVAPGFVRTPLNEAISAPKPFEMSAERAARRIRRGIERRAPMIAFPWPLYAGLRLLALLPAGLGDRILDRPDVDVPETAERVP